ncbi:MAG: cation transporter [Clostridiales bacterium]|nr:cation transporter [Clostridiales bacterium]
MTASREKTILRTSGIGIAVNLMLGVLKVIFGLLAGSVALISDAVNNITDSSSSLITIIGTKIAGRDATPEHPFGFGRIEYLTSMIIGIIVTVTGAETFISSVKQIINPVEVHYQVVTVVVIVATMIAKIILGTYTENVGKKVDSGALKASGADSKNDALISLVTLISAGVFLLTHFSVDAWAGALIAVFIIKTGVEVLIETLSKILGEKADDELAAGIIRMISESEVVGDPHDLVINNYGPEMHTGSVNVEIDAGKTIDEVYPVVRDLQANIYAKYKVFLVFGFYAINSKDPVVIELTEFLDKTIKDIDNVAGYHGIYIDSKNKVITFDITIKFGCDRKAVCNSVLDKVRKEFPDYIVSANIDSIFATDEYDISV